LAALTIREVGVCAMAAVTDKQIIANAPTPRIVLIEKIFILVSMWSRSAGLEPGTGPGIGRAGAALKGGSIDCFICDATR